MAYDQDPPTQMLPTTQPGRHAAPVSPNRWLFGVIGGGAVLAIVLGILAGLLFSGGGSKPKQSTAAGPTATAEPTAEETLEPTPEATTASPSPTRKPSPTPTRKSATQLVASARALLDSYVRAGRIKGDAAATLTEDLRDLARDVADGNSRRAWGNLSDASRHLRSFHREGAVGDREYEALNASLTEIGKALARS
ncbi:MAG: hypothetical protein HOU81_02660 [Hamadaea sp.]|uniref:FIMAH domain-containing protein n=1 Tax=Hamadaea sp. TaxID=2024425 RepID=UPI001858135C|nr:hypothetical protein [Hamadaea sp.]NUR69696.1 hypothetical protein [Hamadaea sp.]NUT19564.1 hypothetical protein [Hamadaea sp.]